LRWRPRLPEVTFMERLLQCWPGPSCAVEEGAVRMAAGAKESADIVVYGGTSAAVIAAVQARRMGKSVLVVSPARHLGGMSSNGLSHMDKADAAALGGLAREFYHRLWRHYQGPDAWRWQKREDFGGEDERAGLSEDDHQTMRAFEPHVAEQIFDDLVAEQGIVVFRGEWLNRGSGVKKDGARITSITTLTDREFHGRAFIDATYEGDLLAAAGVPCYVGREPAEQYDEDRAGVQKDFRESAHAFVRPVCPYVVRGVPASGLLPRISSEPPGQNGQGDGRLEAYCFRLCLTRVPANRIPFLKPDGYDPDQYELLLRVFATGWREFTRLFQPIPNHKVDASNYGPFSTDNIGMNYEYPKGSYDRRRKIVEEHVLYQQGLMYFLANDSRVPEDVRVPMSRWGLAGDEFADNDGWPHELYVRECQRMIGRYVMTAHDCLGRREVPEPVAMGSHPVDTHNVQRYVTEDGFAQNEGHTRVKLPGPYPMALGSLLPRREDCENLAVPVCVSSSHLAYSSIRTEPVFMVLGQSAATVAALALDAGRPVQDVDYGNLRERLLADGQILEPQPAPAGAR
jgi:hypothetical protein